jgi:hypothetical protein
MSGCTPGERISWTVRTTIAIKRDACALLVIIGAWALAGGSAGAQDVRRHTRPGGAKNTTINEAQAAALTLTLGSASVRPVQTWIRTAGTIDASGRILTGTLAGAEAALVKVGQRVRAFPPSSKSSMYQAYVTRLIPREGGVTVEVSLSASGRAATRLYVMEIVAEQGPFLSVPNEAIIEEGDKHIVYVQQQAGEFVPAEIQTGIQGELYTQVVSGVAPDAQVVTFGSFFIDAEHKLKGTQQTAVGSPQP